MSSVSRHLLLLVLGALVPLLLVAVVLAFLLVQQDRRNTERALEENARLLAHALDAELQRSLAALQVLARSEALRRDDLQTFYAEAQDARAALGLWDNVLLLSARADHLLNLMRPYGVPLPPVPQPQGALRAVQTRQPYISDTLKGRVETDWLMYVAFPVVHDDAVRYVIGVTMSSRHWSEWLAERASAQTVAGIIDRNQVILARSEENERLAGQPVQPWYRERIIARSSGVVRGMARSDVEVMTAFHRASVSGWTVNVFMPASVVDAPMQRTAYFVGFAVLGAFGIAVGLAHARARTLTHGLRRMRDAFEALRGPGRGAVAQRSGISEIDGALLVAAETAQELDATEERLRQSEEQFRMIAHATPAMVWVAVPAGDIVFTNARWHEFTGQSEEQARGFGWTSVMHPEDLARLLPQWERCRATGDVYEGECRYRRRDGQYRWHAFRALPNRGGDQTIDRWFGCAIDIHEVWEAREALREADRRKDEFLATLAHELRNPLAPVRNAVQLLKLSSSDDPAVQMAQEVLGRQVGHMVRLIDDLLDVSRIARGKLHLRRQPVELRLVIEQAIETSRPHIRQQFEVHLPPEPVYLDGDPVRLAQVFSNLLNNAAKYTQASGRIVLRATTHGDAVQVSVADSGIGIAPEHLAHVFEMFAQARPALPEAEGGLGIGLSLVRSLVELHGGTITADSAGLGHGAEFIVQLPLLGSARAADATQKPAVAYSGALRRVLVVDDVPDSVRTLAALLRADGNAVETAADGLEALQKAQAFKPDILLLDLGLPKMNGYEVCRAIRQEPWGRGVFIVAVTGWGQNDDRERTRLAGFNDHLVKPIDYEAVRRLLASALAT